MIFLIPEPLTESLKLKGVIKTFDLDTGLGTILDTNRNTRPFAQKGSDFKPCQFVTFGLNGEDASNVFLESETNEENQRKLREAIEKRKAQKRKKEKKEEKKEMKKKQKKENTITESLCILDVQFLLGDLPSDGRKVPIRDMNQLLQIGCWFLHKDKCLQKFCRSSCTLLFIDLVQCLKKVYTIFKVLLLLIVHLQLKK